VAPTAGLSTAERALGLLAIRFPTDAAAGGAGHTRSGTGECLSAAKAEGCGFRSPASAGSADGLGGNSASGDCLNLRFELGFAHTTPSMGLAYFSPRTMRAPRAWVARKPATAQCNVGGIFI
jgi:hypothetical protein